MGGKRHRRCSNGAPRERGMTFLRTGRETSIAIQKMDGNGENPAGGRNLPLKRRCRLRPRLRQDRAGRSGPVRLKESAPLAQAKRQVPALSAAAPLPWIASSSPGSAVRSAPTVSSVFGETRGNRAPRIEALAVETGQAVGTSKEAGAPGAFSGGAKEPSRAETGQAAEASKEAGAPGALLWGAEEASRVETVSEVLQAAGGGMGGQDKEGFPVSMGAFPFPQRSFADGI
jgi:hypothetical protein